MPNGRDRLAHYRCKDVRDSAPCHKVAPVRSETANIAVCRKARRRQPEDEDEEKPSEGSAILSGLDKSDALIFYPAYCHKASPTWFEWARLTAHEIHTKLHVKDQYQHSWLADHRYRRDAPQLMFYMNHPIQFVQVVGVVVRFDDCLERVWLFTIDDSSGLTVDVICRKPLKDGAKLDQDGDAASIQRSAAESEEETEALQLAAQVSAAVEIGAVLQVKGVITLFRRNGTAEDIKSVGQGEALNHTPKEEPVRQISLQRLAKVRDTNQEIGLIAARTQFHETVLSRPWVVSEKEQRKLQREALGEDAHVQKKAKKIAAKKQWLAEKEKEEGELIRKEYDEEEKRRQQDAEEARKAGVQLRLHQEKMHALHASNRRSARPPSPTDEREGRGKPGSVTSQTNHSLQRKKDHGSNIEARKLTVSLDNTNDSFAALDDEKSALLKAAFG